MKPPPRTESIEALILDLDGTLLRGDDPMPGLLNLFQFLHLHQLPWMIATNNATKSPADYQHKLMKAGVKLDTTNILTAAAATAMYLQQEYKEGSCLYVIGEAALKVEMQRAGFILRGDAIERVDAVVVGGDSTLTYRKLKYAALLLQRGARFVGTNPDVAYRTEEGLVPEAGTTLAALQAATGIPPIVIGKPERTLFELAIRQMGSQPECTAVVGDRLETDILGGQRAGMKTILTTTGVDHEVTIHEKGIQPDWVVDGLVALVELLREKTQESIHGNA